MGSGRDEGCGVDGVTMMAGAAGPAGDGRVTMHGAAAMVTGASGLWTSGVVEARAGRVGLATLLTVMFACWPRRLTFGADDFDLSFRLAI